MKNRYISKLVFSDPIMSVYEIIDTKTLFSFLICDDKKVIDEVEKLLNKQDKEIKRYKNALRGFIRNCGRTGCELKNNKAIEVLEKLRKRFEPFYLGSKPSYLAGEVMNKIDIQIAELRGVEK